jgi:hypothetical protein
VVAAHDGGMAKADLKTKPTGESVEALIAAIDHQGKRQDARRLLEIFAAATDGETPVIYRGGMIAYGEVTLRYDSGREIDFFNVGFATRKARHSIYLTCDLSHYEADLQQLGKWKRGAGCLYINKLADVDEAVLQSMVRTAWTTPSQHRVS